jgi:hypothetical protein
MAAFIGVFTQQPSIGELDQFLPGDIIMSFGIYWPIRMKPSHFLLLFGDNSDRIVS